MSKKWRYVIILLFIIAVAVFFGKRIVVGNIEKSIYAETGLHIDIGSVTVYKIIFGELTVKDIRIQNPDDYKIENAADIKRIDIAFDFFKLLDKDKTIDSILVTGLKINYCIQNNTNNISDLINTAIETSSEQKQNREKSEKRGTGQGGKIVIKKLRIIKPSMAFHVVASKPLTVPLFTMTFKNIGGSKGSDLKGLVNDFTRILRNVVGAGLDSNSVPVFKYLNKDYIQGKASEAADDISDFIDKLKN